MENDFLSPARRRDKLKVRCTMPRSPFLTRMPVWHRSRGCLYQGPFRSLYRRSGERRHGTWLQGQILFLGSLLFSRRCKQVLSVKTQPHGYTRSVTLQDDWADSDVRKGKCSSYALMERAQKVGFSQVISLMSSDTLTRGVPSRSRLTTIFSFIIRIYFSQRPRCRMPHSADGNLSSLPWYARRLTRRPPSSGEIYCTRSCRRALPPSNGMSFTSRI